MEDAQWLSSTISKLDEHVVTVVITSYNSKDHVFAAIDSVLTQSLHRVKILLIDDCSTDGSFEAIDQKYCSDPRIDLIRTETNSGAAGGPRNLGIRLVETPYVTFLDSDDVLERHALKNMLFAALENEADVVCGSTDRVQTVSGRRSRWYPKHYAEQRVLGSILDFPELIEDTNSTAKLYRVGFLRDQGILYPEGVVYEDLPFSTMAYVKSSKTVVLPVRVYDWRIYPADVRLSITNQRDTDANLIARLDALALVSKIVAGEEYAVLQEILDVKFLKHDARIYLNDVFVKGLEPVKETLEILRPHLEKIPHEHFAQIGFMEARAYACALAGNVLGVREALLYPNKFGVSAGQIVTDNASEARYWVPSNATLEEFGSSRELLEISADDVLLTPTSKVRMYHQLSASDGEAKGIVQGVTQDPLGILNDQSLRATIVLRTKGVPRKTRYELPLTMVADGAGRYTWNFRVPAMGIVTGHRHVRWNVSIQLTDGEFTNLSPVRVELEHRSTTTFRARGVLNGLFGLRHQLQTSKQDNLEVSGAPYQGLGARVYMIVSRLDYMTARFKQRMVGATVGSTSRLLKYVYPILRRFPIQQDTALFESHMGKGMSDSPKAIADELGVAAPKIKKVWSLVSPAKKVKAGADTQVKRGHFRYFYYLATAKYIVDNQSLPRYFVKRPGQVYLQTWHGIPLKKMGFDEPSIISSGEQGRAVVLEASGKWDGLVVPNEYFGEVFVPAFGFTGTAVSPGTPRNDVLINEIDAKARLRRKFGIPEGKKVVLYAPTFRESLKNKRSAVQMPFSMADWKEQFGADYHLITRSHYLNKFAVHWSFKPYSTDLSNYPEVSDLYLLADVLITDYSSVMFDFAQLNKPIVIYAYDYNDYASSTRGTYFDLREESPGAFVETQEELFDVLEDLDRLNSETEEKLHRFRAKFASGEDGKASKRAVEFLLRES